MTLSCYAYSIIEKVKGLDVFAETGGYIGVMKKINVRYIIYMGLIMMQILVCIYFAHLKRGFFCDEILSYGLANSENYSFIDEETTKAYSETGWVTYDFFHNYVSVDTSIPFSFSAAFQNQSNDVHPPLYYCLLHIICVFNSNRFTKWTGIGLNLLLLVATDLLLYYIFRRWHIQKEDAICSIFLWSCSAAGLSNIVFIRMYLLLTLEIISFVALNLYIFEKIQCFTVNLLLLMINVIIGGLTHYYYYVFAFSFGALVCLYLLLHKKYKQMFEYGFTMCIGLLINLFIFPATLSHIFAGYRGTEVIANLNARSESTVKYYVNWIDQSMFGGLLGIIVIVFLVTALWKTIQNFLKFEVDKAEHIFQVKVSIRKHRNSLILHFVIEHFVMAVTFISVIVFTYVAMRGSEIRSNRYIYPIYPFIALLSIGVLRWIFCNWNLGKGHCYMIVGALMCILSIKIYGIDYQYSDYDEFEQQALAISGDDCILYMGNEWFDVYTGLPLKFLYDETYFLRTDELEELAGILAKRETADPIVVCLPDEYSEEEARNVLDKMCQVCGWSEYKLIYKYYTQAFLVQ